jgi:hypothetical protein
MAFFGKEEYKLPGKEVRVVGVSEVMDIIIRNRR